MLTKTQNITGSTQLVIRNYFIRFLVYFSFFVLSVDILYKSWFGITYLTRDKCILYGRLPHWVFLFYEYFVEMFLVVVVGVFIATLIEKRFMKFRMLIPRNAVTAFLYASVIPVCSCTAVPMIKAMNNKIPFRAVIAFVVAAPLLNPYIIILSFTVLGYKYAVVRILCSFVLAVSTGYIAEFVYKRMQVKKIGVPQKCMISGGCPSQNRDIFESSYNVLKKIFPFIIAAGIFGIAIELLSPHDILKHFKISGSIYGNLAIILIGVPVYFCNGADVLFLQPMLKFGGLSFGGGMAFSLTSTSVCITSLILMIKYIGKRLTTVILISVIILTFLLSLILESLPFLKYSVL